MRITKIESQKKRKNYFNLYCEDVFLFSVTEDTLVKFSIIKDRDYTEEKLEEILKFDGVSRCINQAYRYLSRRSHLTYELRRKLRQKEYTDEIITEAINYLANKNLLDDRQFIRQFIHDQVNIRMAGPLIIKKKLFERGARIEETEALLEELYPEDKQLKNISILYQKKSKILSENDSLKKKQKLVTYLNSRGFEWPLINRIIGEQDDF